MPAHGRARMALGAGVSRAIVFPTVLLQSSFLHYFSFHLFPFLFLLFLRFLLSLSFFLHALALEPRPRACGRKPRRQPNQMLPLPFATRRRGHQVSMLRHLLPVLPVPRHQRGPSAQKMAAKIPRKYPGGVVRGLPQSAHPRTVYAEQRPVRRLRDRVQSGVQEPQPPLLCHIGCAAGAVVVLHARSCMRAQIGRPKSIPGGLRRLYDGA